MIVIGVDPGTHTGLAVWDARRRVLEACHSTKILRALRYVGDQCETALARTGAAPLVLFEDARKIKIHGGRNERKGNSVLQGVGSIKRDCAIWEDYLEDLGVPYEARLWKPGTTKWDAQQFRRITGWQHATNEHARDAACIVYGLNLPMVQGMVRVWEQRRACPPTSTSASR